VKRGLWVAAALVFVAVSASADTPPRVGTVDVQTVLTRSAKGMTAKKVLDKEKDTYEAEMGVRRQSLEVLREEIETSALSPTAKQEKQDQLERNKRDATRRSENFNQALESHEQVLLRQLLEEVVKVRASRAIYERPGRPPVDTSKAVDVTGEVMRRLDAREFTPR
jgi:Skp family chaperone for outer membrane proteins